MLLATVLANPALARAQASRAEPCPEIDELAREVQARLEVAPSPAQLEVQAAPTEAGGWRLTYELTSDGRHEAAELNGSTCRAVHDALQDRLDRLLNTNVRLTALGAVELGQSVTGAGRLGLDFPIERGALHIALDATAPVDLDLGAPEVSVAFIPLRLVAQGCAYPHRDYFAFGVCGGVLGGVALLTEPDDEAAELSVDATVAVDFTARFELSLAAIDPSLRRFHLVAALDVLLSIYRARMTTSTGQELEVEGLGAVRFGAGLGAYL